MLVFYDFECATTVFWTKKWFSTFALGECAKKVNNISFNGIFVAFGKAKEPFVGLGLGLGLGLGPATHLLSPRSCLTFLSTNGGLVSDKLRSALTFPKAAIVTLTYYSYSYRFKLDLLSRCGDIESNPGPGLGSVAEETIEQRKRVRPSLQVISYNVRGLSDIKKVRHLINHCHKISPQASDSIFMLQETFVKNLDILNYIWRGDHHLTAGVGHGLGCITLVTAPFKIIHKVNLAERGHVLVLTKNDTNNGELIVANIYAPNGLNNDKLDFFELAIQTILELQNKYNCDNVVMAGDFNVVFNETETKNRVYPKAEQKMSKAV